MRPAETLVIGALGLSTVLLPGCKTLEPVHTPIQTAIHRNVHNGIVPDVIDQLGDPGEACEGITVTMTIDQACEPDERGYAYSIESNNLHAPFRREESRHCAVTVASWLNSYFESMEGALIAETIPEPNLLTTCRASVNVPTMKGNRESAAIIVACAGMETTHDQTTTPSTP
jgi:hypothetical protein